MVNTIDKCKEIGGEYYLLYRITETQKNIDGDFITVFGAKVVKCDLNGKEIENKEIDDITSDFYKAKEFLELIERNTVTPCTLLDVAEDFII